MFCAMTSRGIIMDTETFIRLLWFLLNETFSLICIVLCIVGCHIPSDDIFAEKYEIKIMRKEMLMNPTLCFVYNLI
jgi:hypothetical protein